MHHLKVSLWQRCLPVLFALIISLCASAQGKMIHGVVVDNQSEPLMGASVIVKGAATGTSTDLDGNFSLRVNDGATLVVSYIGYISQEVSAVDGMRIILKENAEVLEDVVVIGYGTVKKSDATGSVLAVKPDDFNKGLQTSAQDALVGKMPGVSVVSGSGAPGSASTIRIRSGASLSASNDPLIVIDGVPVDNSTIEGGGNVIGAINPNDIETFTVLKDASATAIYGSRASNGVIVITTKKGADAGVKVNYTGAFSVGSVAKKLDVLSADEFRAFVPTVTGVPADVKLGTVDTDWQDEIYRTALGHEHNVSVSGNIKKTSPYRVSLGYTDQQGIIKSNDYQRVSFSGGISPKLFDNHFMADINLKLSYEHNDKVDQSVVNNALRYDPTRPVKTGSATSATDPGLGYFIWMNGNSPMAIQTDNPMAQLELQDYTNKIYRSIGNAKFDYKIHGLEDLQVTLNLGYDVLESKDRRIVPEKAGMMYTSNMKDGTGLVYSGTQKKKNYLLDFYGTYAKTFAQKHDFSVMAGYGWQHFWKSFDTSNVSPEGVELFSATHGKSEYYLLSLYGRLNYSFDNRYLVTATFRSDASSRFSSDNRWGYFPSVALGWRAIEEDFLKEQDVLSDLKVRLSYGLTGQQDILNDYPYMLTFILSNPESDYLFGDRWITTIRPNGYDKDIKWETTETYNFGVDFGFLKNRIFGSVDYYQRNTRDLLNTINVPSGANFSSIITTNVGEMKNNGVELSLNFVPVDTDDWNWTIGFNYTWNDSEITKLNVADSDNSYVETGAISGTGKMVQVFKVGERPYTFNLAKQAYDENGKPIEGKYVQPDGSISSTETRYSTGKSALPKSYFGFNTQVSYKNWDLAINGHGAFGNYVYNYVQADQYIQSVYSDQGSFSNILASTRDTGFQTQQLYSDYWLEKGNFFRIDNITLGYTFHKLWNSSSSLRLKFSVSNVAQITGYSGIDPEIYSGIDREVYPRPRTFTLGANLSF